MLAINQKTKSIDHRDHIYRRKRTKTPRKVTTKMGKNSIIGSAGVLRKRTFKESVFMSQPARKSEKK